MKLYQPSWRDNEGDDDFFYGGGDYYASKMKSYRSQIFDWKKDENIVHPSVVSSWSDNGITDDATVRTPSGNMKVSSIVPGHIAGDIYRLLFHHDPQITKPEKGKEFWLDVLSSLPIYGLSMQTNGSRFWSKIAAIAFAKAIAEEVSNQNPQKEGESSNYGDKLKKMIENAMNGNGDEKVQAQIRAALEKGNLSAQSEMRKTANLLRELGVDESNLQDESELAGHGTDIDKLLKERRDLLDAFEFNAKKATEFLRDTSRFFRNTVGRPRSQRDTLLEADGFHDIINPESLLFPFDILNTTVLTSKYSTRVNLYIDRSGSMGSRLPGTKGPFTIMDAVSIFSYKLWKLGIVDKVYIFDDEVTEIKPSQLLFIQRGGGTCFTNVVKHYKAQRRSGSKSVGFVLTDGCDDTDVLDKDISWMFIEGGPGSEMQQLYSQDSMRIWTQGQIKKIADWNGR